MMPRRVLDACHGVGVWRERNETDGAIVWTRAMSGLGTGFRLYGRRQHQVDSQIGSTWIILAAYSESAMLWRLCSEQPSRAEKICQRQVHRPRKYFSIAGSPANYKVAAAAPTLRYEIPGSFLAVSRDFTSSNRRHRETRDQLRINSESIMNHASSTASPNRPPQVNSQTPSRFHGNLNHVSAVFPARMKQSKLV
jgi:hypothetical protein